MKEKISVIIPFLNESENIPFLVSELNSFFSKNDDLDFEVIFVDDGSSDDSVVALRSSQHVFYKGKVIVLSKNFGSHAALRAGIMHATGEYICFMYADMQDPLELIRQLYLKCKSSFDICWATRAQTENSFAERTFSKVYSYMMKKYAIASYPEKGFDVVMFNRKVQGQVNANIEANSSLFLQILTLGFKQEFIFYNKTTRKRGKSKWTLSKKVKLFIDSFVAFSYAPIRFVTILGFSMFIIGSLWTVYIIVRKLMYDDLSAGWPALVSILTIGFGITNISLGIIAEYLWRTLDASRRRPVFLIDDIFNLETPSQQ
jgi:dolichol-phosphate mannosyltransferase